jgi:predicted phosphodiesterase
VYLLLAVAACADSNNERGPYLQSPTPTSIVVKWRNGGNRTGKVSYGTVQGQLFEEVERKTGSFDHEVLIENLLPDTVYYYRVNGANESEFSFRTPPEEGVARPTRVWILGDAGTANANAGRVRDAFYRFNKSSSTDLMIMLGDNAYEKGTDSNYQDAFFNVFAPSLYGTPVFSTIGNHDVARIGDSTYFDIFTLPEDGSAGGVPSGTEAYYSFNYANIHFVSLDSELSNRSPGGAMYSWLMTDLEANTQDWTIVFFHQPPYSKGSRNSDARKTAMSDFRQHFTAVFELYGVDLVFSGHSHSYERSFPIRGHRGRSDTFLPSMKTDSGDGRRDGDGNYLNALHGTEHGIIYTVAGSAGKARAAPLNHPVHFVAMSQLGSVVLDFDDDTLDVTFVSPNPKAIDYYTVVKNDI